MVVVILVIFRLEGYMEMLGQLQERADNYHHENQPINEDFEAVKEAIQTSLQVNLTHKN